MRKVRINGLALVASALLLLAMAFAGWKAWEQALAYEDTARLIIGQLDTDSRLEEVKERVLEWLSLGLYQGNGDRIARLNDLKRLQQEYGASVQIMTGAFFAMIPPFLFALWRVRRERLDVAYGVLMAAFVALVVGLTAPILSIESSTSLPLLGETVLQFESKGVLSTLASLMSSGNLWIAVLLFLFSVVVPLLKTLITGLTFFFPDHRLVVRGLNLSKDIGRWSMADVFVVAILVAFFSTAGNGITRAEVQAGLYFFAGYVVLALVASQLISRSLFSKEEADPVPS